MSWVFAIIHVYGILHTRYMTLYHVFISFEANLLVTSFIPSFIVRKLGDIWGVRSTVSTAHSVDSKVSHLLIEASLLIEGWVLWGPDGRLWCSFHLLNELQKLKRNITCFIVKSKHTLNHLPRVLSKMIKANYNPVSRFQEIGHSI